MYQDACQEVNCMNSADQLLTFIILFIALQVIIWTLYIGTNIVLVFDIIVTLRKGVTMINIVNCIPLAIVLAGLAMIMWYYRGFGTLLINREMVQLLTDKSARIAIME